MFWGLLSEDVQSVLKETEAKGKILIWNKTEMLQEKYQRDS